MPKITKPTSPTIHVGEQIELSLSASVRVGSREAWVKYAATITRQPDESSTAAQRRLESVVTSGLQQNIDRLLDE